MGRAVIEALGDSSCTMSVIAAMALGITVGPLLGYALLSRIHTIDKYSYRTKIIFGVMAVPISSFIGVLLGGSFGGSLGDSFANSTYAPLRQAAIPTGIFLGIVTISAICTTIAGLTGLGVGWVLRRQNRS